VQYIVAHEFFVEFLSWSWCEGSCIKCSALLHPHYCIPHLSFFRASCFYSSDAYPPQSYCQYSCYQAGVGYPDFSPCCPDVVDDFLLDGTKGDQDATAAEDGPCIPCTDIPDEFMLDNGSDCLTDDGIVDLCGKDGSWWYNLRDWDDDWVDPYAAETYCQYSCDARGLPYPSASNCCAERGSDVNEFYNYGGDVADVAEVVVTPEPTPTPIPEFGDLDVDGDCDGEDDDFCGLCQGDCDDDIDVS